MGSRHHEENRPVALSTNTVYGSFITEERQNPRSFYSGSTSILGLSRHLRSLATNTGSHVVKTYDLESPSLLMFLTSDPPNSEGRAGNRGSIVEFGHAVDTDLPWRHEA